VVLEPVDPNTHFRARRKRAHRRRRLARLVSFAVLVLLAGIAALAVQALADESPAAERRADVRKPQQTRAVTLPPLPYEMRGVHVTMALAALPGKVDEYLDMAGLNTIELDVKDENGEIGFIPSSVPLARQIGAAAAYYRPRQVAKQVRKRGVYLIGRVVVFEDPILAEKRPELAVRRPDGSVWRNHAGLGWTNPYERRVWEYNVDIAAAAARAGFDEIQFDYVRFPSDGDVESMVFPRRTSEGKGWTIARFLHYARKRLRPLGVRVSADVFGLSATRDLGIGQVPRRMARFVDAIYPMVYPSHYNSGEYGLDDPNAVPAVTVAESLRDFRRQLRGTKAKLIPWLQDFSLGRTYTLDDVREQILAARELRAQGFLLWNPAGVYTHEAFKGI
jgi:hypothetical protein